MTGANSKGRVLGEPLRISKRRGWIVEAMI